jgi:hypothetical protein
VIGSSADVRTTLNIEDGLYREAKVRAAREGVTVTSVVEEALRQLLRSRPGSWQRGELPALPQTGGLLPGVDLRDNQSLYDILAGDDVTDAAPARTS